MIINEQDRDALTPDLDGFEERPPPASENDYGSMGESACFDGLGHSPDNIDVLVRNQAPEIFEHIPIVNGKPRSSERATSDRLPHFALVPFHDIRLLLDPYYLVKGLIPREGLVVIWGPPKCGKSFWAFDLVMHIALGREYRDHRVNQGPVVYVACEGERALGARAEAYRQARLAEDHSEIPFYLITTRLDLVGDRDQLIHDISAQIDDTAPVAIVIDTLNRSLRGSESSDEDMAEYVKAADAIRDAFNCAVIIIHHCGIEGSRPRGHTSLTGACDAQIAVKRDFSGIITTVVEWMKDGAEGEETFSRLEVVEVGTDTDGEPITSCVVEAAKSPPAAKQQAMVRGQSKIALELLTNAIVKDGEAVPQSSFVPTGVYGVRLSLWRGYCDTGSLSSGDDDGKRKAFDRAKTKLREIGRIGIWDGLRSPGRRCAWPLTNFH